MSPSGIRLRISLLIAIAAVSINVYSVLDGTAERFYAGLKKNSFTKQTPTAAPIAQVAGSSEAPRYSFAALEIRTGIDSNAE